MQHHLYGYWVNDHRLDKANLKNNSRQYTHTSCFEEEFRICVLEILVLRKRPKNYFWKFLKNLYERIHFSSKVSCLSFSLNFQ